jgi:uncharacterized protein YecE (DUF72 family)
MIYVGTCGYAYKDWIGPFYPGKIKSAEMLPFYTRRFRAVEIDSSYYGVPAPTTIAAMNARTPPDFRFAFKAPQTVTHAPEGARMRLHPDAALLSENIEPLREAGKLAAVLLQFPNGFKPVGSSQEYLRKIVDGFDGLPLVAEFRHRDWQTPATFELLRELGVGWCNVDLPRYDVLPLPSSDATAQVGYVRMHGRNAAMWWVGDNVTRYDYNYDPGELAAWTDRIAEIDAQTEQTFVFFNNHANGQAAGNAELLEHLLEEHYGDEAAAQNIARPTVPSAPQQNALPGL